MLSNDRSFNIFDFQNSKNIMTKCQLSINTMAIIYSMPIVDILLAMLFISSVKVA